MTSNEMNSQMSTKQGFIAALDQSGGSTPGALRYYGIPDSAYSGETEMFKLMHEMRVRIMSSPAFTGDKVIGAILFEGTMDGQAKGKPVPAFLWEDRGVVPFLKVDKGLETEKDGVCLMKPIPGLDSLLERAAKLGVYGTKMRSTIHLPSKTGIAAIVAQQFAFAAQIAEHGLMPILEPEVLIKSPDKPGAEAILREELARGLDELPVGHRVMLKVTIPDVPDYYSPLIEHSRVARVVALSGGYSRKDACHRLATNHGMIASFSRALVEDLRYSMSDTEFDASLSKSSDEIYQASVAKVWTDLPAGKWIWFHAAMVVCENYLPVVALNDSGSAIVQVPSVVNAQVGIHFKEPKRELELSRLLYKLHLFRLANLLGLGLFSVMTVRTIKSSPVAKKTLVKRAYRAASAIKSKSAMAKKAARKSK